jgi:hypothetical protein
LIRLGRLLSHARDDGFRGGEAAAGGSKDEGGTESAEDGTPHAGDWMAGERFARLRRALA